MRSCHWGRLQQRMLSSLDAQHRLRLVELRGFEERYPVLQSLRVVIGADCSEVATANAQAIEI